MTSSCNYFMLIWFLVLKCSRLQEHSFMWKRMYSSLHSYLDWKHSEFSELELQPLDSHFWYSLIHTKVYVLYVFTAILRLFFFFPFYYFCFLFITSATLLWPFNPWEWSASNFSFQYQPWMKHLGHENKRRDHQ